LNTISILKKNYKENKNNQRNSDFYIVASLLLLCLLFYVSYKRNKKMKIGINKIRILKMIALTALKVNVALRVQKVKIHMIVQLKFTTD